MPNLTAIEVVKRNSLLSGLPAESIDRIAGLGLQRKYPDNTLLFAQGEAGNAFFGIVSGSIRISINTVDGKEMHIVELAAGDTFGEIALIDGGARTASAVTTSDTTLLVFDRARFLGLLDTEPDLSRQLLNRLCERVRWTSELVEDLSVLDIPSRIAKRICILARSFGTEVSDGIEIQISQHDLAAFLGLSRQAVNSHLQEWRRQGWLELKRGRILVTDIDSLGDTVGSSHT